MKPAEIVTVVVSIPVIAALLVAEAAGNREVETRPAARTAEINQPSPVYFDEIVVTASRSAIPG
ncbi:MAG: hypothetical protein NW200_07145 [Hyphomonadaceae bacterium]|nr:hypothetical protein [Hyphomonadaceae bacterium]